MSQYYQLLVRDKIEVAPELAFFLLCACGNPTSPPRARSTEQARSMIWSAVALVFAAREARCKELARLVVDETRAILPTLREIAPNAARSAEMANISDRDTLFIHALSRALLGDHPTTEHCRVVGMMYPRTVLAIHLATLHSATDSATDSATEEIDEAITSEWQITSG